MIQRGLLAFMVRKFLFLMAMVQAGENCGQSFFDIIPDLQSVEMQGGCRVVYALDSNFVVFGHRYDTSYEGSNAKPWMGKFDYKGRMTGLYSLRDTSYNGTFIATVLKFTQKSTEKWYGYSARFINSVSTPYLYEFDIRSGEITSSVLLPNTFIPGEGFGVSNIYYSDNRISLLSYQQDPDSVRLYITELDSTLTFLREFRVQAGAAKQFPKFFERKTDGTYLVIANSRRYVQNNVNINDAAFMHIDSNGQIIRFQWSPSPLPISIFLSNAKTVIKGKDGSWVLSGTHFLYPDSCTNCSVYIPYKYSVSPDFDSLLWQIAYIDIPYNTGPHYHEYGLIEVSDGYVGCGEFFRGDIEWRPSSGRIYKTSLEGDSLWTRNIIPIGWDEERVVFADFYDVKETPYGTLIVVGHVVDKDLEIIRPWVLHLDKDGCLVPGCGTVGIDDDTTADQPKDFSVYPNPVFAELYILSKRSQISATVIKLVNSKGQVLQSTRFTAVEGAQYSFPMNEFPVGVYHIVFENRDAQTLETHTVIKP